MDEILTVEFVTFALAALVCIAGALGVVGLRNPVHNALSLVATLFGVAVLFIAKGAYFLAAIQVIVYAGAVVVVFLFVIMLLGVDTFEATNEPDSPIQRALAIVISGAVGVAVLVFLLAGSVQVTGTPGPGLDGVDVNELARSMFTRHLWAFEVTSVLLGIAVVSAVLLARKVEGPVIDDDRYPDSSSVFLADRHEEFAHINQEIEHVSDSGAAADDGEVAGAESPAADEGSPT